MRFTDIRTRITEVMKFKEYIMWVSETDKKGVYAYEEVQPLVRCKDCVSLRETVIGMGVTRHVCMNWAGAELVVDTNGFCAWGERVEGSE